jgi:hypothetical protein
MRDTSVTGKSFGNGNGSGESLSAVEGTDVEMGLVQEMADSDDSIPQPTVVCCNTAPGKR